MKNDCSGPIQTSLRPGQNLHAFVEDGTILLASAGQARLTGSAAWLDEQVIHHSFCLLEGQPHVVAQGGWIVVQADRFAELTLLPGVRRSVPARLRAFLCAFLWAFRQASAGRAM